jgi:hypothetical protein
MKNDGDKYEIMTMEQLELEPFGSGKRSNKYIHDATLGKYPFELKSCSGESGKISTGRGVSHKKLESWRGTNWIFTVRDRGEIQEHILVKKSKMEELFSKIQKKIEDPGPKSKFAGTNEIAPLRETLLSAGWTEENVIKMCNTFERGTRLNDPRISLKDVRRLGEQVTCREDIERILENE